jgi:hypothetical protein
MPKGLETGHFDGYLVGWDYRDQRRVAALKRSEYSSIAEARFGEDSYSEKAAKMVSATQVIGRLPLNVCQLPYRRSSSITVFATS